MKLFTISYSVKEMCGKIWIAACVFIVSWVLAEFIYNFITPHTNRETLKLIGIVDRSHPTTDNIIRTL